MVTNQCKLKVKEIFKNNGIHYFILKNGEVEIMEELTNTHYQLIRKELEEFELIDDLKVIHLNKIKNVIIEIVHYSDQFQNIDIIDYLTHKLNMEYDYMSNLFFETYGTTIEYFFQSHKMERIKELMVYENLTLKKISQIMGYNNASQLSFQFKKTTGLAPSFFKSIKINRFKLIG